MQYLDHDSMSLLVHKIQGLCLFSQGSLSIMTCLLQSVIQKELMEVICFHMKGLSAVSDDPGANGTPVDGA